ncbi:MAG: FAD-dependent oxidoreductase [Candidatus Bipolaricaulota bacterium]|nr:FAD-dependent oxidoreductase [Candidatus Bipolaricaulota bacterium]
METWDVVIVGGGPAGLSAAIYAPRAGMRTLLLERALPGGQMLETPAIENYPGFPEPISGFELAEKMRAQAERLGAHFRTAEATALVPSGGLWEVRAGDEVFRARAVIAATGARPKELSAPGAKDHVGRGVSYCAVCDGFFFRDKTVLVVGGGDGAFTEALHLAHLARKVYLAIHRGRGDPRAVRAKAALQEKVFSNPKVEVLWGVEVAEVRGERNVDAVLLRDVASGDLRVLPVDGVFVKIGWKPNTDWLRGVVPLTPEGYVRTDPLMGTEVPGVFAAGDVRDPSTRRAQAVVAASEGALAALSAEGYNRAF